MGVGRALGRAVCGLSACIQRLARRNGGRGGRRPLVPDYGMKVVFVWVYAVGLLADGHILSCVWS